MVFLVQLRLVWHAGNITLWLDLDGNTSWDHFLKDNLRVSAARSPERSQNKDSKRRWPQGEPPLFSLARVSSKLRKFRAETLVNNVLIRRFSAVSLSCQHTHTHTHEALFPDGRPGWFTSVHIRTVVLVFPLDVTPECRPAGNRDPEPPAAGRPHGGAVIKCGQLDRRGSVGEPNA